MCPNPSAATMNTLLKIAAHQVGDDGMWLSANIYLDERMQGLNDNEVCGLILKELGQVDGVVEVHWRPCPSV
ncbi:hypothetical protein [Absidia glauca]|uniref:Uncharacterized protein n=1 Tax=Absidia glauca TaxID=4829 RepID=A0A168STX0_ABSGL|nr:hypothetical protein [Absidia glauca]